MAVAQGAHEVSTEFAEFCRATEPRLRQALVATYGPVDGREATVDALSWAWEHWARLAEVANKPAYLYRVGQSAVRRFGTRPIPWSTWLDDAAHLPEVTPELAPALARLSEQQRSIVLLVHGFGWSQADVAGMLDISPSTVHAHLDRALTRLRAELEVSDDH
jgi:DNA-directed RNA polymerase specialized sigma24 family protein